MKRKINHDYDSGSVQMAILVSITVNLLLANIILDIYIYNEPK